MATISLRKLLRTLATSTEESCTYYAKNLRCFSSTLVSMRANVLNSTFKWLAGSQLIILVKELKPHRNYQGPRDNTDWAYVVYRTDSSYRSNNYLKSWDVNGFSKLRKFLDELCHTFSKFTRCKEVKIIIYNMKILQILIIKRDNRNLSIHWVCIRTMRMQSPLHSRLRRVGDVSDL